MALHSVEEMAIFRTWMDHFDDFNRFLTIGVMKTKKNMSSFKKQQTSWGQVEVQVQTQIFRVERNLLIITNHPSTLNLQTSGSDSTILNHPDAVRLELCGRSMVQSVL